MMATLRFCYPGLPLSLAGLVLATRGGSSSDGTGSATPEARTAVAAPAGGSQAARPEQPFSPVVAGSGLAVGGNRFALGILDNASDDPLPDAQVQFRFFTVQGNQGTPRSEAAGRFIAPGRDAGIANTIPHRHADGPIHHCGPCGQHRRRI